MPSPPMATITSTLQSWRARRIASVVVRGPDGFHLVALPEDGHHIPVEPAVNSSTRAGTRGEEAGAGHRGRLVALHITVSAILV